MGKDSKIEWTDHTFNPWIGCQEVSAACDFCYARVQNEHRKWVSGWGPNGERKRTSVANWRKPLAWNAAAAAAGVRAKVFCASLADVFDNDVPPVWREELFRLIAITPHLDWLLLTKRPQNIEGMLARSVGDAWTSGFFNHVWLGTTVENQAEAKRRIPHLVRTPATVHFLSVEPMLGPVDIKEWCFRRPPERQKGTDWDNMGINWVICGGESGGKARPMHPQWARDLRDQCADVGVAFLFKQWGEWTPGDNIPLDHVGTVPTAMLSGGEWRIDKYNLGNDEGFRDDEPDLYRIGKVKAGRLLDGRTHDGFPAVSQ